MGMYNPAHPAYARRVERLIDKVFRRPVRCLAKKDDTMHVHVNGEPRTLADGMTVAELLRQLDIRQDRVAVEVNLAILDRGEFDRKSLREGDRVEIISFIGGGSVQSSAFSFQPGEGALRGLLNADS